jgi:hypothetical protein
MPAIITNTIPIPTIFMVASNNIFSVGDMMMVVHRREARSKGDEDEKWRGRLSWRPQ